jgi:ATP-dependent exoDNAse (exonuclease V) beta subunit
MKFNYTTEMQVDTLSTGRTYFTPGGAYPSITTVLGKTANNPWLAQWKARVGEEEAARVSKEATDRGTLIHSFAERHFNGESIWEELRAHPLDIRKMTRDLISVVEPGVEEIYGQEQILWSNKYRAAGRTDMVGVWKGKPTIIDFKTSKKAKQASQIRDYFLQCCFYAIAHNELYDTNIRDCVIAITNEVGEPQLFEKSVVPFLYEFKNRRAAYDRIIQCKQ